MKKALNIILILFLAAFFFGVVYPLVFPNIPRLKKENPRLTSFMKYRQKEWKKEGKNIKLHYSWTPLSKISPFLINAVLIAEDDKFYQHRGFDVEAIKLAIKTNVEKKRVKFGGSTITQQLAKNLYLSPSKSLVRKIREAILTWRLEKRLTKKRILELYLNVVEWGNGIFGVEAASRHYFGKPASSLRPEESARLAVILPSPRRYRLDGNSDYIEKRTQEILAIMEKRGIISR